MDENAERLSTYVDELNSEKGHRRPAIPTGEEPVYAAARALKSLRAETPASRTFARRLARTVGRPVTQARLQAGLARAAALVLAGGIVAGAGVLALAFRTPATARFVAKMTAAAKDLTSVGITGYTAVYHADYVGYSADYQFIYLAPDKTLLRDLGTDRVDACNGQVRWSYDPSTGEATLDVGPLPPMEEDVHPGFKTLNATVLQMVVKTTSTGWPTRVGFPSRRRQGWQVLSSSLGRLAFGGREVVAGRNTRVLRLLAPGEFGSPGYEETRYWVDEETFMVLKEEYRYSDGRSYGTLFSSLDLTPPSDPTVFDPHIPEGAALTRMKHGALPDLASEVGLGVREPASLPVGWKPEPATLSLYPSDEPDTPDGGWRLSWSYAFDPDGPGLGCRLTFSATSLPPTIPNVGQRVEILPGLSGWYVDGRPSTFMSGLSWSVGDVYYDITGSGWAIGDQPYFLLGQEQLVELARSIMPGE